MAIGRLKELARAVITRNRRSAPVRALHGVASFVESAYANEGAIFSQNGEQSVLRKLRPADFRIAFDVGGNFGDWSSEAISAWPNCQVQAFEVAPETFKRLKEVLGPEEKRGRVVLNCCGLSDQEGSREMYYYPDHPEVTAEVPRYDSYRTVPFQAQLRTGDRYCDQKGIDSIDFLKIDVEGSEHRVLKGFSGLLGARKIHCIQFEYGAFSINSKFLLIDYHQLLSESYWIGKIFPGYVDFREYDWRMEDFRFANYCCVSKARPDLKNLLA